MEGAGEMVILTALLAMGVGDTVYDGTSEDSIALGATVSVSGEDGGAQEKVIGDATTIAFTGDFDRNSDGITVAPYGS